MYIYFIDLSQLLSLGTHTPDHKQLQPEIFDESNFEIRSLSKMKFQNVIIFSINYT